MQNELLAIGIPDEVFEDDPQTRASVQLVVAERRRQEEASLARRLAHYNKTQLVMAGEHAQAAAEFECYARRARALFRTTEQQKTDYTPRRTPFRVTLVGHGGASVTMGFGPESQQHLTGLLRDLIDENGEDGATVDLAHYRLPESVVPTQQRLQAVAKVIRVTAQGRTLVRRGALDAGTVEILRCLCFGCAPMQTSVRSQTYILPGPGLLPACVKLWPLSIPDLSTRGVYPELLILPCDHDLDDAPAEVAVRVELCPEGPRLLFAPNAPFAGATAIITSNDTLFTICNPRVDNARKKEVVSVTWADASGWFFGIKSALDESLYGTDTVEDDAVLCTLKPLDGYEQDQASKPRREDGWERFIVGVSEPQLREDDAGLLVEVALKRHAGSCGLERVMVRQLMVDRAPGASVGPWFDFEQVLDGDSYQFMSAGGILYAFGVFHRVVHCLAGFFSCSNRHPYSTTIDYAHAAPVDFCFAGARTTRSRPVIYLAARDKSALLAIYLLNPITQARGRHRRHHTEVAYGHKACLPRGLLGHVVPAHEASDGVVWVDEAHVEAAFPATFSMRMPVLAQDDDGRFVFAGLGTDERLWVVWGTDSQPGLLI